jgi:hypothetical protein
MQIEKPPRVALLAQYELLAVASAQPSWAKLEEVVIAQVRPSSPVQRNRSVIVCRSPAKVAGGVLRYFNSVSHVVSFRCW